MFLKNNKALKMLKNIRSTFYIVERKKQKVNIKIKLLF